MTSSAGGGRIMRGVLQYSPVACYGGRYSLPRTYSWTNNLLVICPVDEEELSFWDKLFPLFIKWQVCPHDHNIDIFYSYGFDMLLIVRLGLDQEYKLILFPWECIRHVIYMVCFSEILKKRFGASFFQSEK